MLSSVAEPAVSVRGIVKRFVARRGWLQTLRHPLRTERVSVVCGVEFDVRTGEFFGLLGPNGAGKTTLFRMLSTAVLPDEGQAFVHGLDVVADAERVRAAVGSVFSNERTLFWRLSAVENMKVFAALHGIHGRAAVRRIEELLVAVGLHETGTKMVATFSSGMRQRLLIARALIPRPRVLLLDEPTRSLDPISARGFREFLRAEIVGQQECTVLLATHSSEEALELCDRVAVLDHGRLLAVGAASELARRYGDQSFTLWTRTPEHPAVAELLQAGAVLGVTHAPAAGGRGGWWCVQMIIPDELSTASDVLRSLVSAGMDVARFEQRELSLAELLERVTARGGGP